MALIGSPILTAMEIEEAAITDAALDAAEDSLRNGAINLSSDPFYINDDIEIPQQRHRHQQSQPQTPSQRQYFVPREISTARQASLQSAHSPQSRRRRNGRRSPTARFSCSLCPNSNFSSGSQLSDHRRAVHVNSVIIRSSIDKTTILAELLRDPITNMFNCCCGSLFKSTRNALNHRKCFEPVETVEDESESALNTVTGENTRSEEQGKFVLIIPEI